MNAKGMGGGGIGFIATDGNALNVNGFAANGLFEPGCAFKMFANGFGSVKIKEIKSFHIKLKEIVREFGHLRRLKMLLGLLLLF